MVNIFLSEGQAALSDAEQWLVAGCCGYREETSGPEDVEKFLSS